jgi:hypothetical protein
VSSQVGQSDELSVVGDASVVVPTANRAAFLYGLLQHFLCGCAFVLPFLRLQGGEPTWVALSLPALLIAVGIGFPLQSWIGRTAGLHVAARFGLVWFAQCRCRSVHGDMCCNPLGQFMRLLAHWIRTHR